MKTMMILAAMMTSLSVSAFSVDFPSFGNDDFAATSAKAQKVALKSASAYASDLGLKVVAIEELQGTNGLTAKYLATTNSECEITVAVGLFFKSKIVGTLGCE